MIIEVFQSLIRLPVAKEELRMFRRGRRIKLKVFLIKTIEISSIPGEVLERFLIILSRSKAVMKGIGSERKIVIGSGERRTDDGLKKISLESRGKTISHSQRIRRNNISRGTKRNWNVRFSIPIHIFKKIVTIIINLGKDKVKVDLIFCVDKILTILKVLFKFNKQLRGARFQVTVP